MKFTVFLNSITGHIAKEFARCSRFSPTPLSLKQLVQFGKNAKSAESFNFLKKELPIRIANIMQEILLLPDSLHETSNMKYVIGLYKKSFTELLEYEDLEKDESVIRAYTECIKNIHNRHVNIVETVAQGVMEVKELHGIDPSTEIQFQYFLDRFYLNRISIRMLINQHVTLFGSQEKRTNSFIGIIDSETNILDILINAFDATSDLCRYHYGISPDMVVSVINHIPSDSKDKNESVKEWKNLTMEMLIECSKERIIDMYYIPSHLYHMVFELLKNATRAVIECHSNSTSLPPINILVCGAQENITIKISDFGGGIPHSLVDRVFRYTFTTAKQLSSMKLDMGTIVPIAGYGYGLPLSRLYARYFNGDITLSSVEGFGTDALIYLKRKPADADELLPVFNKASARQYSNSVIQASDWSKSSYRSGIYNTVY